MARELRIELAGGFYHVTIRGANREDIFFSDFDRRYFLKLLSLTHQRHFLEVHAYCLMTNHVHLLVRTPEPNLAKVMQLLNGSYAQYFNRLNGRTGPVFDGRYFSSLIDSEAYLTAAAAYVHRNPVAAGLVERARDWQWSSQKAYVRVAAAPSWLFLNEVLRGYTSEAEYECAIDRRTSTSERYKLAIERRHPIVGRDAFISDALDRVISHPETASSSRRVEIRPDIEVVEQRILEITKADREALQISRKGVTNLARSLVCFFAFDAAGLSLSEVADRYGYASYKGVSASNQRLKSRMSEDAEFRVLVESLQASFSHAVAAA